MDANNVATAFVSSANQYAVNQTEMSLKQLQRHLEILVCLTSEETNLIFFQTRSLLSSQCITHVINVILDTNVKQPLLSRALSVLQNFLKNPVLLMSLQTTFHVHSVLSTFLQQYGMNTKDPLVLQCLQILGVITYNIKIDYVEHHFENLISTLFNFIDTESSQVVKVSFHILSNFCRNNPKVQSHICSFPNIKQIVKKLVSLLNSSVPSSIILYALSVLSSITPYNHFGPSLWTDEHILMTFDLIAKLLFCDDLNCATTALDLFTDLVEVKKHQSCFAKSPSLIKCLKKISKLLFETPTDRTVLYLKFLLAVSNIPDCLHKVCSVLCVPTNQGKDSSKIHPMLVKWCGKDIEEINNLQIMVLKIILNMLNLSTRETVCSFENSVKEVLKNILESIHIPVTTDLSQWNEYLEFNIAVFEILAFLCKNDSFKTYISQNINISTCKEMAQLILNKCIKIENICYDQSVDLFLMVVETIISLGGTLPELEQVLNEILDDSTAMHCISYALTSNNSCRINRGLSLLSQSKGKCSLNILGESLFQRNSSIHKSLGQVSDTDSSSFSSDMMPSAPKKPHLSRNKISEKSIDSLLSKIENGLQFKDLKSSEIMDLYEHKIAMLTLKEQELQSYVDVKTAALQEADRVITQYKCRQADAEAEALRLRSMMKDYECRSEQSSAQLLFAEQKQRKVEGDLLEAYQKIKVLEQDFNQQRELTQTQMNRLSEQKKNTEEEKARLSEVLSIKEQEKKVLVGQMQQLEEEVTLKNKMIKDVNEQKEELLFMLDESKKATEKAKLSSEQKQQHLQKLEEKYENLMNEMNRKADEFSHQISDLEIEKEQLTEQLKLRDSKIEDLNESLKKLNESFNQKNETLQDTSATLAKCKGTLEQTEAKCTKLQQDKNILELLCKKYESSIEEKDCQIQTVSSQLEVLQKEHEESMNDKDGQIKHLQDELAKHEYITGMIHNLTSGKLAPPK